MSKFWVRVIGTTEPTQVTCKQDDNIDDLKKAAKAEMPKSLMADPHDIKAYKDEGGQDYLDVALKLSDLTEANSSHNPIWLKLQEEPQPKKRKLSATDDKATLPPGHKPVMASSSSKRSLEGYEWITWEDVLGTSGVQKEEQGVRSIMTTDIPSWIVLSKSFIDSFYYTLKSRGCTEQTAEKFRKAFNELSQRGRERQLIEKRCPSPSSLADESQWSANQKNLNILCHRPPPVKCHGLHVSLQIETFATFMDDIKSEVDSEYKYIDIALEMMFQLCPVQSEDSIKTGLTNTLAKVFPKSKYSVQSVNWNQASAAAKSDISISSGGYTFANVELKKGLGSGGKDANIENIGYFIKIQRHHQQQHAPMFLVSIVGCHYLQVFGAAWDGDCVCVDPLCSPLSLLYVVHDPNNGVMKVARLLSALATAVDNLKNEYDEGVMQRSGPYFNTYNDIELKNMKNIANKNRVFRATADGKDVVVKFVLGKYGLGAHNCLAEQNLAPRVLYSANLRGGWVVVVMEKIQDGTSLSEACMNEDVKASLCNAVDILHLNNFVHGDLRPVNILALRDDTVRILDFDWADIAGVAKYPVDLNMSLEWHQEVQRGCLIREEHDNYLIGQILHPDTV